MSYIKFNDDGTIKYASNIPYDDYEYVSYDVVQVNGKLYKKGTEPAGLQNEMLFAGLRGKRDARLAATDKYLLPDYPITAEALEQVKVYRAALRALPEQAGAPWDGGGELTPWPELPAVE